MSVIRRNTAESIPILTLQWEFHSGEVNVIWVDGKSVDFLMPKIEDDSLEAVTFYGVDQLSILRIDGIDYDVSVANGETPSQAKIVYLDQNHWVEFARWELEPAKCSERDQEFFSVLADAVNGDLVRLPLSFAHLGETTKRQDYESRRNLSMTMLKYSRGWQMSSALHLREIECNLLFSQYVKVPKRRVFSQNCNWILPLIPGGREWDTFTRELEPGVQRLHALLTLAKVMLSGTTANQEALILAERWANSFTPLALELSRNSKAKAHAQTATNLRFIIDARDDFAQAAMRSGLSPEEFMSWLENESNTAIRFSPGLGRLREVLHLRLMNVHEKWEINDLNDWMYLSYASAYADVVLAEKKMTNYLNRIRDLVAPGAAVTHKRSSALEMLKEVLPH